MNSIGDNINSKQADIRTWVILGAVILVLLCMSSGDEAKSAQNTLILLSEFASFSVSLKYLKSRQGQDARIMGLKTSAMFNTLAFLSTGIITALFYLPDFEKIKRVILVFAFLFFVWFIIGIFVFWRIGVSNEKQEHNEKQEQ